MGVVRAMVLLNNQNVCVLREFDEEASRSLHEL
jgi:hypothetical protein